MNSIGEMINGLDRSLFEALQTWLGQGAFAERMFFVGNLYFWTPLFAFLAVLLYQMEPRRGAWNILFGFGVFVLSYQAATVLSVMIGQPAPYVFAALEGVKMPAFVEVVHFSLPDWATAALTGSIVFVGHRIRSHGGHMPWIVFLLPIFFCLGRILPGYAFPLDALTGILIGSFVGFLFNKLAQNFEVVTGYKREPATFPHEEEE